MNVMDGGLVLFLICVTCVGHSCYAVEEGLCVGCTLRCFWQTF